jgi:hypothetical protein
MTVRALLIATALAAGCGPAWAEAPVATTDGADLPVAVSKGPASPTEIPAATDAPAPDMGPDRRPHGQITVAVGTGGYRSAQVEVHGPLGDRGEAGVVIEDTRWGRGYGGYRPRQPFGAIARGHAGPCVAIGQHDAPPLPDGAAPRDPSGQPGSDPDRAC